MRLWLHYPFKSDFYAICLYPVTCGCIRWQLWTRTNRIAPIGSDKPLGGVVQHT